MTPFNYVMAVIFTAFSAAIGMWCQSFVDKVYPTNDSSFPFALGFLGGGLAFSVTSFVLFVYIPDIYKEMKVDKKRYTMFTITIALASLFVSFYTAFIK